MKKPRLARPAPFAFPGMPDKLILTAFQTPAPEGDQSWHVRLAGLMEEGRELDEILELLDAPKLAVRSVYEAMQENHRNNQEALGKLGTNRGLAGNAVGQWVHEFANRKDPLAPTWAVVDSVVGEATDDDDRDWLARDLLSEAAGLQEELGELPADGDPKEWNRILCTRLEGLGAMEAAERWHGKAQDLEVECSAEPGKVWSQWVDFWGDGGWGFMAELGRALWAGRQPQEAGLKAPQIVIIDGEQHVKTKKTVAAMSWAIDGAAVIDGPAVDVDGKHYASSPGEGGLSLYLPRNFDMMPSYVEASGGQKQLPFVATGEDVPIAVGLSRLTAERTLMSPVGGKLAVLLACGWHGQASLQEWTELLHPGIKRIRAGNLDATAQAVKDLEELMIYLPDGTRIPVFTMKAPYVPTEMLAPDATVGGSTSKQFDERFEGGQLSGWERTEKGSFIINLSGFLGLDNRSSQLQRYYLRAAAMWNAARRTNEPFNQDRLETFTPERFALLCNSLPPAAADYMSERKGNRQSLAKAKRRSLESLEELEGERLIRLERPRAGRKSELLILPPDEIHEAWSRFQHEDKRKKRKKRKR